MEKVILSLGSSLGNRIQILNDAVTDISFKIGEIEFISDIYESEPWGFEDENLFYNIVLGVNTNYNPFEILSFIQEIENKNNRIRNSEKYEARTLDIDIIFYGQNILYSDNLIIPHKFTHLRKFVLEPLNQIYSDFYHPFFKCSVNELLTKCPDNSKLKLIRKDTICV